MGERAISHKDDAVRLPWYRRDLFQSCKSGEIVEAEPQTVAQKLRTVVACAAIGVPVVLGSQWFFKVWTPRYRAELDALAKIDPVESARKLAEFTSLLLLAPVSFAVVAGICVAIHASRLVRAGRRPLPGAKVRVRTEVVAGWWCVRLPALVWGALALVCALVVWGSYVRLAAMLWNGWLDKTAAHSAAVVAARSPQDPGVDFDLMMRSHHDAAASTQCSERLPMRTTIDIPEQEHALFTSLSRAQHASLSKLLLDLVRRGSEAPDRVAEAAPSYARAQLVHRLA